MSATAVSLWPTPTVSITITSKPAASQASAASRVRRVTPPSVAPAGDGRMKASGAWARRCMRVLSPRIEPPERRLEGSTASTATWWPCSITCAPSASIRVDLPAPGVPEMPSSHRVAGRRQQALEQPLRLLLVIGLPRFDQRDRARQRPPVAVQDALRQGLQGRGHR